MPENNMPVFLRGHKIINTVVVDCPGQNCRITRYYIEGEQWHLACFAQIRIIDGWSGDRETEVTVTNFVVMPVGTFNVLPADALPTAA